MADAVLETISLLEWRLARIEFVLRGDVGGIKTVVESKASDRDAVNTRLNRIEAQLSNLRSQSLAISDLLNLHADAPDLFTSKTCDDSSGTSFLPNTLPIVLSSANLFSATASQLSILKTLPMPHAGALMPLVALQPRLARASAIQGTQAEELDCLRIRSAMVIAEWYRTLILREGEHWSDCEQRIAGIEQATRRRENARRREGNEI